MVPLLVGDMAHPSKSNTLHMIMFMLVLLSLHCTRSRIVAATANHDYYNDYKVQKVSGVDEKEGLIVEKLRALLGLRSFRGRKGSSRSDLWSSPTPSPSPSMEPEAPAPSLAPVRVHFHAHPGHKLPPRPSNKGKATRVVVSVVASAVLVCVLGFICVCFKLRRRKREKGRSRNVSSSATKVSGNPGLDLIYLNSLEMDLERENPCPKQDSENAIISPSPESALHLHNKEEEVFESDECDDNNKRDILADDGMSSTGNKITNDDEDEDDDSFHSFCDSHSSHFRLSNASIASLSDKSETVSPKLSKSSPSDPSFCFSTLSIAPSPPPPPPLPPPLSPLRVPRLVSKAPGSPTLTKTLLSPRSSPPLPTQGNVPPPPCPPPFLGGNGKAPPPPPPQLQAAALGKDGSPLPKLKPLHWDKVRATPDRSMVWDKMRSSSFELDEEMMESLFGYNLHNSVKNDEAKSKTPSPGKHILDQKRLQNITILSKALNASPEQICLALIQGEGLCLQQLEALAKMVPTKEEEAKLCSYKGDRNELGSAERFVIAVLSIPFAFLRIQAMLYRETFEDEVIHLRRSFSMLEEACKELRSSRLFLKLLEAVLKTGNRMNVGTIRGGAKAFKLDTLLKLADVKGTDGRTTLLHFVVQEIIRSEGIRVSDSIMGKISGVAKTAEEREEEYRRMGLELVAGLSTELYNVKKTATIDLDVLASSVSNLSEGLARLNQLVDKDLGNGGNFVKSMKAFLSSADNKLEELQQDESNVMVHVRQVTEYFHGELSKSDTNPLRIFVIVRDFLGMLDHVCKELRSFKAPASPNPLPSFR